MHWIEISKNSLLHNLRQIRSKLAPRTKFMAMVKANAYGHGLKIIVPCIANHVDYFGVNTIEEALTIRKLEFSTPVLVCGPIETSEFTKAKLYRIELCINSLELLNKMAKFPLMVHLKINTGMNRLGISPDEVEEALSIIRDSSLSLVGVYTHFYNADAKNLDTQKQFAIFQSSVIKIKKVFPNIITHCANTSATLTLPKSHLDMVRIGLGLYGLWPSPHVKKTAKLELKPVLSWRSNLSQVRVLGRKQTVGYSATYVTNKKTTMGIIPIGYSDGLDRKLSNQGRVYLKNRFCPIIGRVAMNFSAINISEVKNPSFKDIVEVIGPKMTVDKISKQLGTINYEIVSRLNPLIPRIIV